MLQTLSELNNLFSHGEQMRFVAHPSGWPVLRVDTAQATAELHLYGGHLTHFQPRGQAPVLWLSDQSLYQSGKAVRGGIPLIWPWFGPHPTRQALPQHGFARTSWWHMAETALLPDGRAHALLQLRDSEISQTWWPHPFLLELAITVGEALEVALTMTHLGHEAVTISAALHTYLAVGDISKVRVRGLEGTRFVDKTTGGRERAASQPLAIQQEVDRVYVATTADCVVEDAALGRAIRVGKTGSRSTVVWNPWQAKARAMADFPDDGYRTMLCVETTAAPPYDTLTLPPQASHRLSTTITVEP